MALIDARQSIAARLVFGYGLMAVITMVAISTVFYFGTVGVVDRNIDNDIKNQGGRLAQRLRTETAGELAAEVTRQLNDGVDSDREIYLVTDAEGKRLAGNLSILPARALPSNQIVSASVVRNGVQTRARLIVYSLPTGGQYIIGDDLRELDAMQAMVWRALATGALLSLGLTIAGALLFRQQIARRITEVRQTTRIIAAGDLSRRIATVSKDEFGLLNQDINHMLDRIEQLMNGVRDVSNAIAHDLRTPLTRIRAKLEVANRRAGTVGEFRTASLAAIGDIDDLIRLFECLLQIAEAEAGVGTGGFDTMDLAAVAGDMAEMYGNTFEDSGMRLDLNLVSAPVHGDRNLMATAIASLIENAVKYGADGGRIDISAAHADNISSVTVRDYGRGIPAIELARVAERFYRLERSRSLPGNGLGLSIVTAIVKLHGGSLSLENAEPGLRATIRLPAPVTAPRESLKMTNLS